MHLSGVELIAIMHMPLVEWTVQTQPARSGVFLDTLKGSDQLLGAKVWSILIIDLEYITFRQQYFPFL